MKRNTQLTIFIVSMTIAAILGFILSTLFIVYLQGPDIPIRIPPEHLQDTIISVILKTVFSFMNMTLIILTLVIYINIYRNLKSRFTLGLVVVLLTLFMNAITSTPVLQFRFGIQGIGPGPFLIFPDIFTFIALTVLFYLSLE